MKKLLQIFCLILISGLTHAQIPTDNLVAWFPFNGNANDVTGNGHNGTVYGATLTTDRFGNANSAYSFNGIDNRITAPIGSLTVQSFSFWFKAPQPTGQWDALMYYNYLYSQIAGSGSPSAFGEVCVRKQIALNDAYEIDSPSVPQYNTWHYVYYDYTPSSQLLNLYIDNVYMGTGVYTSSGIDVPIDYVLTLGSHPSLISGFFYTGVLDDIRIYSRVLTPDEITALYNESSSYAITAAPSPINAGYTSGGGIYQTGTEATVLAIANTGWSFINWTENGTVVSTSSSYQFAVSGNRSLIANFIQQSYAIATSSNPSNGGTTTGGGTYLYGSTITVNASVNAGWYFQNWTENGTVVSTSSSYQFAVSGNRSLIANFIQQTYAIATSSNPSNGGTTTGDGTYLYGSTITVNASANAGWYFQNWTENGTVVSTTPNYSIIVIGAHNLVANFVQQSVLITADANPVSGGITSGGGYYGIGSQVFLLATPNVGYSFLNWTEFGSQVSTSPNYGFIATINRNLVANYSTTGVEELSSSTLVYPNPTSGIVMIKSYQNIKTVEVVNLMGCPMKSIEFQHLDGKIDLSNLPKGIYFIHFTLEDREFTQKIVVI
jgi:hypothetical protein